MLYNKSWDRLYWARFFDQYLFMSSPGPANRLKIRILNRSMGSSVMNAIGELVSWHGRCEAKNEAWRKEYNELRPHSSLSDLTPGEFIEKQHIRPEISKIGRYNNGIDAICGERSPAHYKCAVSCSSSSLHTANCRILILSISQSRSSCVYAVHSVVVANLSTTLISPWVLFW